MHFQLALVTGASSGIGAALCHVLAAQGIDLIITGRDVGRLEKVANTLKSKVNVMVCPCDLLDESQRLSLIDIIKKEAPDLIINNAGVGLYGPVIDCAVKEQLDILDLNGRAVVEITTIAAQTLKQRQKSGVILNVSSAAAFYSFPGFALYAASKMLINRFSMALDVEMQREGIRVLTACPGQVKTPFIRRASRGLVGANNSRFAMTAERVAEEIWWQIQKGKTIHIFDWRYRLAALLTSCLPEKMVSKVLRRSLSVRY